MLSSYRIGTRVLYKSNEVEEAVRKSRFGGLNWQRKDTPLGLIQLHGGTLKLERKKHAARVVNRVLLLQTSYQYCEFFGLVATNHFCTSIKVSSCQF